MPILGRSEGDEALAALGVRRLALPIPFAEAGGPINAYLLENGDGSVTLFDTGLNSPTCAAALRAGFAEAGHRLEEVSRVLVSHGHVDHYGLARLVQDASGAKVHVPRRDWNKVVAGRSIAPMDEYLLKLGVRPEQVARVAALHHKTEAFGLKLERVEPLEAGARFRFLRFEGEILAFPGHTPGLVCLHDARDEILFTDDHLLGRVSPNPLMELGENGEENAHRALAVYYESVRRLREMELRWLLPGHGEPFAGHRAVIDGLFDFYGRRQAKIEAALDRPKTAMELVADVFGEAGVLQLFLMLSEIVGNLEVLEDLGRVTHDPSARPYLYRRT